MYTTENDLSEAARTEMIEICKARLAEAVDLQMQCKYAHWNVKGPNFIALHELFDKIHGEVEECVDLIAERIATLGGVADGRVRTAAYNSKLDEYPLEARSGEAHLRAVANALAQFGKLVRDDIDKSSELGDAASSDIFTAICRATDKQLWFVEAHLTT